VQQGAEGDALFAVSVGLHSSTIVLLNPYTPPTKAIRNSLGQPGSQFLTIRVIQIDQGFPGCQSTIECLGFLLPYFVLSWRGYIYAYLHIYIYLFIFIYLFVYLYLYILLWGGGWRCFAVPQDVSMDSEQEYKHKYGTQV